MFERYLLIVAVTIGFLAGLYVDGLRCSVKETKRETAQAQVQIKAHEKGVALSHVFSSIETEFFKGLSHVKEENAALRNAVAAGATSLRVATSCDLPAPTARVTISHGAGARLNPALEPDYYALREGIGRCRAKVTALQEIIRQERMDAGIYP